MASKMKVDIHVDGMNELVRQLEELGRKRGKVVVRKGVNKSSTIWVKAAKRSAPIGKTGNLRSGLTKRLKSYNGGAFILAVMGNKIGHGGAAHAHLVEFGTKQRHWNRRSELRKAGLSKETIEKLLRPTKATGKMPSNPFMRRAFDGTKAQMAQKMADVIRVELAKEAARGAKK